MTQAAGATHPHVFHVDLSDAPPNHTYVVVAAGARNPLVAHDDATRAAALAANPALSRMTLTHYTQTVAMPLNAARRVHVKAIPVDAPQPSFVHAAAIITPPQGAQATENAIGTAATNTPIDWVSTAQALVFHHPDLMTSDPTVSSIVMEHISEGTAQSVYEDIVNIVVLAMREAGAPSLTPGTGAPGTGWATLVPVPEPDSPAIPGLAPTLPPLGFMQQTNAVIQAALAPIVTQVMVSTKNDTRLMNKKWTYTPGASVQSGAGGASPAGGGAAAQVLGVVRPLASPVGDGWSASVNDTDPVHGLTVSITSQSSDENGHHVSLHLENSDIRYLGAYIQFLGSDMSPMSTPTWMPDTGASFFTSHLQYDNFRGLGAIEPITTVFGIPVFSSPGTLDVVITFPDGAVAAGIYGCGLGTGSNTYPNATVYGGVMTGLANLAVPAFMLGFGVAGQTYKPLYDALQDDDVVAFMVSAGVAYFGTDFAVVGAVDKKMDWNAFSSLAQLLFSKSMTKVLTVVTADITSGEAEDQIPFAGWIMLAINIATGLAQLAETIAEVATSPWNIPNQVSTSITTTVNVNPDPRKQAFPQPPAGTAASWTVKMIFQADRPTLVNQGANFTGTSLSTPFANTLGGQVKFECDFYLGSWLAAKATTGWLANTEDLTATVTLTLVEQPVPLTASSTYQHSQILCWENGAYQWVASPTPPTATLAAGSSSTAGNAISVWQALTLSQRYALLAWAWKAAGVGIAASDGTTGTQVYALQSCSIPGVATPTAALGLPSGFSGEANVIADPYPPKFMMDSGGNWVLDSNCRPLPDPSVPDLGAYWVDPTKASPDGDTNDDTGYHLRRIDPPSGPIGTGAGQLSWGRFRWSPDAIAIHPSGNVIAINNNASKIMVLQLPAAGLPDLQAPFARAFAGQAINFSAPSSPNPLAPTFGRAGLLANPLAVACSYDGTVLILEDASSSSITVARIQAFDLKGNPVDAFVDAAGNATPLLGLPSGVTYLSLAVAGSQDLASIYVLYYENDGSSASDYNVAIYQYGTKATAQNPLVTTNAVAAAQVATDMWHTLYALNYTMTTDGGLKNPAGPSATGAGPAGRTVPSVSMWLPPVPKG